MPNILFHGCPHQRRMGIDQELLRRLRMPLITRQHRRSAEGTSPHNTVQYIGRIGVEWTILFTRRARRTTIVQQRRCLRPLVIVPVRIVPIGKTKTHPISRLKHWIVHWLVMHRSRRERFQHVSMIELGRGASITTCIPMLSQLYDIFAATERGHQRWLLHVGWNGWWIVVRYNWPINHWRTECFLSYKGIRIKNNFVRKLYFKIIPGDSKSWTGLKVDILSTLISVVFPLLSCVHRSS